MRHIKIYEEFLNEEPLTEGKKSQLAEAAFSVEDGIKIQSEQLAEWKKLLQPKVYKDLEKWATEHNDKAESGNQIIRGSDMSNFIGNYFNNYTPPNKRLYEEFLNEENHMTLSFEFKDLPRKIFDNEKAMERFTTGVETEIFSEFSENPNDWRKGFEIDLRQPAEPKLLFHVLTPTDHVEKMVSLLNNLFSAKLVSNKPSQRARNLSSSKSYTPPNKRLYEESHGLNEALKSKKQLFSDLEKIDPERFKGADLGRPHISDETYGDESMIYVSWADPEERKKGEAELKKMGHKVNSYDEKGKSSEVQVSYFKGWHWDI